MLEAGGAAPPFLDIPLIAPMIQKTPYDWQYVTIPQKHACKALINNVSIFAFCEKKSNIYYTCYTDFCYSKADGLEVKFLEEQVV